MNSVVLAGRLTKDPTINYSQGGSSVSRFTVAVDRQYKRDDGDNADFISCVAFGKTAEFMDKYFSKGQRIILRGRIQTGSYTKQDGTKVYTTDVVAESVEFGENKRQAAENMESSDPRNDDFMNIPDDIDDEALPFN